VPQPPRTEAQWKPVVGWEKFYRVSDLGEVLSIRGQRHLTGTALPIGHLRVRLSAEGVRKSVLVHRLVLEAFVGPCPEGSEARHLNGDPQDNRLVNLRWGTRSENILDQVEHGRHQAARRTTCSQGHPLDGRLRDGRRYCKTCSRERRRVYVAATSN